jgi:hypothetical protein
MFGNDVMLGANCFCLRLMCLKHELSMHSFLMSQSPGDDRLDYPVFFCSSNTQGIDWLAPLAPFEALFTVVVDVLL